MPKHRFDSVPSDIQVHVSDFTTAHLAATPGRSFATAGVAVAATALMALAPTAAHASATPETQPVVHNVVASTPAAATYTVVAGDTLSKIAPKVGTTWQALAARNGIPAPYTIRAGQVLQVPSGSAPAASAPAPASAPAAAPATSKAATAVAYAKAQVGDAYAWAGTGPNAWDCSGLTVKAWAQAGVTLSHSSSAQGSAGTATTRANLVPGDLVVYFSPVSHVAMYIGNGQVVQAANAKYGVNITSIDWAGPVTGYRHIG